MICSTSTWSARTEKSDMVRLAIARQRDRVGTRDSRRRSGREALDRFGFAVVTVENRDELGDHEQVLNTLRHVQELQAPALAADARVGADDLAEARAVDVGDRFEV